MRKILLLLMIITIASVMAGCSEAETVEVSKLDTMEVGDGKTTWDDILDVEGEDFKIVCSYDTGDYDLNDWRITDSKSLSMTVKSIGLPEDKEILIEHVHCDINIKSTVPSVDGLQQDSMDDSYHGTSQDGFYIDDDTIYKNIFAIDGYSETLLSGWGYVCGSYGSLEISEERLTEKNLIVNAKAYAQKMQIVYDISIKNKDDEKYHTVSVISEFLVPLDVHRYDETDEE